MSKEEFWKIQLRLWQESGLSVRAFCKEQGIVETSFYAWRRELIIRARESGEVDFGMPAAGTRNSVKDARGRTISVRFRQTDHKRLESALGEEQTNEGPFVALSLVENLQHNAIPETTIPEKPNEPIEPTGLKVQTPSGYTLVVTSETDLALLSQTLRVIEGAQKC